MNKRRFNREIDYRINCAKKLIESARHEIEERDGKHLPDILDGIESHIDRIESNSEEKYIVCVSANTGFAEMANVCVVDATSEEEAREKVDDMDNPQNFGSYRIERVSELRDNWSYFR